VETEADACALQRKWPILTFLAEVRYLFCSRATWRLPVQTKSSLVLCITGVRKAGRGRPAQFCLGSLGPVVSV
jgi:hypothetical protein